MKSKILIVDDEKDLQEAFAVILEDEGYEVCTAANYDDALMEMDAHDIDLIFADIILGGKTGIDLLRAVKEKGYTCPVVMITGAPSIESAALAVRLGAYDYIPKPVNESTIVRVAAMALRLKKLNDSYERSKRNLEAIFRSVKDAIITVNEDLQIIEMNQAADEMCGLKEDAIGKPIGPQLENCSQKCIDTLKQAIHDGRPVEVQYLECIHAGKPKQIVNICAYPLMSTANKVSGAVMVLRDETRYANIERLISERRRFFDIIGGSEKMRSIYSMIETLSDVESTVLITGESGTGKELVAESLHFSGVRSTKPLVKVNCSALSEQLLESELFGHVRGAFTGAIRDKTGRFELADRGTIFLDEIGDISPAIQVKLLRVLQSMEFERVGDTRSVDVNVRVVAATNKDIEYLVSCGKFREDLFYRLSVIELHLPPLRERTEDIPLLTDYILEKLSKKLKKYLKTVTRDVLKLFMEYSWPGNIRELQHTLEHAAVLTRNHIITVDDLSPKFLSQLESVCRKPDVKQSVERLEVIEALNRSKWKKAKAARLLGVSRTTLYQKIRDFNIYRK